MESLDAQGAAIRTNSLSLTLTTRAIPDTLVSELTNRLPKLLPARFESLVVKPEYDQAWKQTQLIFQDFTSTKLGRIDAKVNVLVERTEHREIILTQLFRALDDGRLNEHPLDAARAQIETLTAELQKFKAHVGARKAEPGETALSNLLAIGDLDRALRVKNEQVESRRGEVDKLARDFSNKGRPTNFVPMDRRRWTHTANRLAL